MSETPSATTPNETELMLKGYGLTTAEVLYRLPDYPSVLNTFVWQDYDLARLTWLWDVTTVADKTIVQSNQQGVNSRYYEPGPLAGMEHYTQRFLNLYADRMSR